MPRRATTVIFTFLLLALAALSSVAQESGQSLAVSVREGQLRSAPGFLSGIEAIVRYGESLTILERSGEWLRARRDSDESEGWIHSSALAPPEELNLTGEQRTAGETTSREVALAGRGFNEQVEREYQEQQELDFGPVTAMEELILPTTDLAAFLDQIGAALQEAQ